MPAADNLAANARSLALLLEQLDSLAEPLDQATNLLRDALLGGQKVLCCGNGGSAADAAHFAAEIAGRFQLDRPGYPALDLTSSSPLTSSLSNDFSRDELYARQVSALGQPGDVLIGFSTSGQSENIRLALTTARRRGLRTVAFLGRDGGPCRGWADVALVAPASETPRIQELHLLLYHTVCQTLDPLLAEHQAAATNATSQMPEDHHR